MAGSVSRGCTSGSRSLLLSLAQPKTRNSRRALVTRAIRGGLRSAGPPARHLEQTMPLCFFNIRSGTEYLPDEDGDECPSLQAAGKRADHDHQIEAHQQSADCDTNYWGVVHGSLIAARYLRQPGGKIINTGSVLSERAMMLQGPYSASKHAVKGFTDALRM